MTLRRFGGSVLALCVLAAACASDDDIDETVEPTATVATTTADTSSSQAPTTIDQPAEQAAEPGTATAIGTADENSAFPDIIAVRATREDAGTWRFDVTVSSPYDTPDRYADAWRVLDPSGVELGIRILTHDHASEQPFTRSQGGIAIPGNVTTVTIEGRDLVNGWGGESLDVVLPT